MSPPIPDVPLQGREAYSWAWLLHGPIANAAWSPEWEERVRVLYPRNLPGWDRGRLTLRNGAVWARVASDVERRQAQGDTIALAPESVRPTRCPECHGATIACADGPMLLATVERCGTCHGSGMVHAYQEAKP